MPICLDRKYIQQLKHHELGRWGEDLATDFCENKGYRVIQRNFRSRFGEVDVICADDTTLIFIEVKTRRNSLDIPAIEAVNDHKISHMIRSAGIWLSQQEFYWEKLRWDVITIDIVGSQLTISHIQDIHA